MWDAHFAPRPRAEPSTPMRTLPVPTEPLARLWHANLDSAHRKRPVSTRVASSQDGPRTVTLGPTGSSGCRVSFAPRRGAVRRSARVSGSWVIRVMTAMCRARFSRRSPPRFSRWRTVLPEEAGIGFTPANEANAASSRRRPSCDHAAIATAAVTGPIPTLASRPWRGFARSAGSTSR